MGEKSDVVGVGSPLLDHLIIVEEKYLDQLPGKKDGMEPVSYHDMIRIIEESRSLPQSIAGGSCANAIKGLASLGHSCAMIGKIGQDSVGQKVMESFHNLGILTLFRYSTTPTAQAVCLITSIGERTCRTFLGAGQEMTAKDLNPSHFSGAKLVHIEGYTLLCQGVAYRAMKLAKEEGAAISFDLGSFEVVETYKEHILELLEEYVDIVFSNTKETLALTGKPPKEGCGFLKNLCNISIVMVGPQGCWVGHRQEIFHCPAHPCRIVDRTGAGDLFASGFLHGFLLNKSLMESAKIGSILGGSVVEVVGAEIPPDRWPSVRLLLNQLM
ncbi:MAG: adenosine kinase [Waddliaceae bacterium]